MGAAKVASEYKMFSQASHRVTRYSSRGSIFDVIHEGDRTSNHYEAVICMFYVYVIFGCRSEVPKFRKYERGLIKLDAAPVSSRTEFRFKTCRIGPEYA